MARLDKDVMDILKICIIVAVIGVPLLGIAVDLLDTAVDDGNDSVDTALEQVTGVLTEYDILQLLLIVGLIVYAFNRLGNIGGRK